MAYDPNKLTMKSQEALVESQRLAEASNNQQIQPEHLLAALVRQSDGVVLPVVQKAGVAPKKLRDRVDELIQKLPKVYGGTDTHASKALKHVLDHADMERTQLGDDYVSVEHLLLAL